LIRKDYIERMVEQLAEFLAKLLQLRQEHPQQAAELVEQACVELLGIEYQALTFADAASAAAILAHPQKVAILAALVQEQGEILGGGQTPEGRAKLLLALDLYERAQAMHLSSKETDLAIRSLRLRLNR
jgi:hypothetical protein